MALNTKFKIELEKDEKKKEIEIVIQEINKAQLANITCECAGKNGSIRVGDFITAAVENGIIISPKNLIEQLEDADNGLVLYAEIFKEVNRFCSNPKRYVLLQKESELKGNKQN